MTKLKNAPFAFTFDDFMLVPQHSTIKSRKDPDVSTQLGQCKLSVPIVAAPMNTVTEHRMVSAMSKLGGSSVLHRYMSSDDQLKQCMEAYKSESRNFFVAIGATGDFLDRAWRLYDTLGVTRFCIDMANGHSDICLRAVAALKEKVGKSIVMAGNVCTYEGAYHLTNEGADIIRVGVGPGSMCKTRIVTGHGVPQLTAIEECAKIKEYFSNVTVVADGGIRNSGDIIKALAIGADAVMVGGLLAGTEETPGEVTEMFMQPGRGVKKFAGMASEEGRKFNGWFNETDASFVPEGEATEVPYKGPVENIINNLVNGLKVGMTYAGASNIQELQENVEWVRVTENGRVEGTPHGK